MPFPISNRSPLTDSHAREMRFSVFFQNHHISPPSRSVRSSNLMPNPAFPTCPLPLNSVFSGLAFLPKAPIETRFLQRPCQKHGGDLPPCFLDFIVFCAVAIFLLCVFVSTACFANDDWHPETAPKQSSATFLFTGLDHGLRSYSRLTYEKAPSPHLSHNALFFGLQHHTLGFDANAAFHASLLIPLSPLTLRNKNQSSHESVIPGLGLRFELHPNLGWKFLKFFIGIHGTVYFTKAKIGVTEFYAQTGITLAPIYRGIHDEALLKRVAFKIAAEFPLYSDLADLGDFQYSPISLGLGVDFAF